MYDSQSSGDLIIIGYFNSQLAKKKMTRTIGKKSGNQDNLGQI